MFCFEILKLLGEFLFPGARSEGTAFKSPFCTNNMSLPECWTKLFGGETVTITVGVSMKNSVLWTLIWTFRVIVFYCTVHFKSFLIRAFRRAIARNTWYYFLSPKEFAFNTL